jgi:hypothetical protein
MGSKQVRKKLSFPSPQNIPSQRPIEIRILCPLTGEENILPIVHAWSMIKIIHPETKVSGWKRPGEGFQPSEKE